MVKSEKGETLKGYVKFIVQLISSDFSSVVLPDICFQLLVMIS